MNLLIFLSVIAVVSLCCNAQYYEYDNYGSGSYGYRDYYDYLDNYYFDEYGLNSAYEYRFLDDYVYNDGYEYESEYEYKDDYDYQSYEDRYLSQSRRQYGYDLNYGSEYIDNQQLVHFFQNDRLRSRNRGR
ncbi:DNA-directed RNA polymerase subunit beta'-like isoform X2 [Parasteatoda tepidariorum]|uniref:DNA-directed RNA polymerase subunit beta'-like isoform X2 n=1 Tax=Parasteatoda tepidariorum TaxID=114398 RepID=UPI001C720C45|nr:putative eggshell protein isoform X2 [Parasteatoda tepidariorum]